MSEIKFRNDFTVDLIDGMGGDMRVVQAARVSLLDDDRTDGTERLIKYLLKNGHWSPFEHTYFTFRSELPIFLARQFMRHRSQCLAGDSVISFEMPSGQHYPYELEKLYRNWQLPHMRPRLQGMRIRSMDERTGRVYTSRLVDVMDSGVKTFYRMTLSNGMEVVASADHRVYTSAGWRTIGDLIESPHPVYVADKDKFDLVEQLPVTPRTTEWRPVPEWEDKYEVSDGGEVRSLKNTRGVTRDEPLLKKASVGTHGYPCVSLSRDGVTVVRNVHQLVLSAFVGPCPEGQQIRHLDGNRLNPNLDNLTYGTPKENAEDRATHGTHRYSGTSLADIESIVLEGEGQAYDIEVEGPYHNFFANGVVVHNSFNEMSMRYSEALPHFYLSDTYHWQSDTMKQGRGEPHERKVNEFIRGEFKETYKIIWRTYTNALAVHTAREQAREVLPVSAYTVLYTTLNLRSLLHLVGDRTDPTAQSEAQVYANQILDAVKDIVPITLKAWKEVNSAS